jgi:hypothetical protein
MELRVFVFARNRRNVCLQSDCLGVVMSKDIDRTIRMTPETLKSYIEKARDEGFEKAWKQAGHLDLDLRQRDVQIAEVKAENAKYREALEYISKTDTRDPETEDLVIWLNHWRNYTKQIASEALKGGE